MALRDQFPIADAVLTGPLDARTSQRCNGGIKPLAMKTKRPVIGPPSPNIEVHSRI